MYDYLGLRAAITSGTCPTEPDPTYAEKIVYWTSKLHKAKNPEDREYYQAELDRLNG